MSDEADDQKTEALEKARRKPLTLRPPKQAKIPRELGPRIDALYAMRQSAKAFKALIKEAELVAAGLAAEEEALAREIRTELKGLGLESGRGAHASFAPSEQPIVIVDDWEALYEYIKANDAFEMLHRRTTTEAFVERWDAKVKIPGVHRDSKLSFSLTKVGPGKGKK